MFNRKLKERIKRLEIEVRRSIKREDHEWSRINRVTEHLDPPKHKYNVGQIVHYYVPDKDKYRVLLKGEIMERKFQVWKFEYEYKIFTDGDGIGLISEESIEYSVE